jgi:molybdopterin molybdotransferase
MPAYLSLVGEVPMGDAPAFALRAGQCAMIHTGGMLPDGADAVVMLEYTQHIQSAGSAGPEIEIFRAVADNENVIRVGEDVAQGQLIQARGSLMRPAEIGGLMALGITRVKVARKPRIGLISTGDEVVDPSQTPRLGQGTRCQFLYLVRPGREAGGIAERYGIR